MSSDRNEKLTERALGVYKETFAESTIKDTSDDFPRFAFSELTLGKRLGEGGFGVVSEVLAFDISAHENSHRPQETGVEVEKKDEEEDPDFQGRKFIADHCIRNDSGARYAIKILKQSLVDKADDNLMVKALADMAVETHILSAIEHPNIVKLRGVSQQGRYHPQYFIVMDRLYDTLEKRIEAWAKVFPKPPPMPKKNPPSKRDSTSSTRSTSSRASKLGCIFGRKSSQEFDDDEKEEQEDTVEMNPVTIESSPSNLEKKKKLLEERLVACFDLASAIAYLHERNIIYRDTKPENCAFDVRGDIKLFDFGTAKELPPQNAKRDLTFNLTGMTGSLPWMAPEVAKSDPYNHKVDVFSFAVLLWQIMALEMPFKEYESDLRLFWEEVHNGPHKRPQIPRQGWPKPIELCMRRGWAKEPSERMEMSQIENILRKEIIRVRKGDEAGLRHDRRRSTFVFRR
ncbi:activated protein kinase kinase kinase 7 [Seminavis robusta]|uniref:Activated protein kinase kinase kinase 7 n=1 Tax=Seminavis robusta TaxID=568900 RepID=A0A9N8D9Z4_9STRA|nr:activated protein kinase kinase kinase 7 [Seminavis robusta]|eukprot:Sro58_g033750.1 activated protein kinase kinase kinase 7 (457) ;mRNA; f:71487-72968